MRNKYFLEINGKDVDLSNIFIWKNDYSDLTKIDNLACFIGAFDNQDELVNFLKKFKYIDDEDTKSIYVIREKRYKNEPIERVLFTANLMYNKEIRYMDEFSLSRFLEMHQNNVVTIMGRQYRFIDYVKEIVMNTYQNVIDSINAKIKNTDNEEDKAKLRKSRNNFSFHLRKLKNSYPLPQSLVREYIYFGNSKNINKANLFKLTNLFMNIKKYQKGFDFDHGYFKREDTVNYYKYVINSMLNNDKKKKENNDVKITNIKNATADDEIDETKPYKDDEYFEDTDADEKYNMDTTKTKRK